MNAFVENFKTGGNDSDDDDDNYLSRSIVDNVNGDNSDSNEYSSSDNDTSSKNSSSENDMPPPSSRQYRESQSKVGETRSSRNSGQRSSKNSRNQSSMVEENRSSRHVAEGGRRMRRGGNDVEKLSTLSKFISGFHNKTHGGAEETVSTVHKALNTMSHGFEHLKNISEDEVNTVLISLNNIMGVVNKNNSN